MKKEIESTCQINNEKSPTDKIHIADVSNTVERNTEEVKNNNSNFNKENNRKKFSFKSFKNSASSRKSCESPLSRRMNEECVDDPCEEDIEELSQNSKCDSVSSTQNCSIDLESFGLPSSQELSSQETNSSDIQNSFSQEDKKVSVVYSFLPSW